jgi:hypothetical protein
MEGSFSTPARTKGCMICYDLLSLHESRVSMMAFAAQPGKTLVKAVANILPMGDALTCVPWLLALAELHDAELVVEGPFNPAVKDLLSSLPLHFDEPDHGRYVNDFGYVVQMQAAYSRYSDAKPELHVVQAHFALAGMRAPDLPVILPLRSTPCGLPPSVLVSPFSAHDRVHERCWFDDRWNDLITRLLIAYGFPIVYVIASAQDDVRPFQRPGVQTVVGRPLTEIVDLIARSPLFLSIDTGPSHIAHLIGKREHVLLYPTYLNPGWACNPQGRLIQAKPIEIMVEHVLEAAAVVLSG